MPVKGDLPIIDPPKPSPEPPELEVDPREVEGFHVLDGKTFLGTYPTQEDADCFIAGHLTPQGITATVVEGHAPAEAAVE